MTRADIQALFTGQIVEDEIEFTVRELAAACRLSTERIHAMVDVGLIDPDGREPSEWRFRGVSVRRILCAQRLQRDLGVNAAGAALALELLEKIEKLQLRLRRYE